MACVVRSSVFFNKMIFLNSRGDTLLLQCTGLYLVEQMKPVLPTAEMAPRNTAHRRSTAWSYAPSIEEPLSVGFRYSSCRLSQFAEGNALNCCQLSVDSSRLPWWNFNIWGNFVTVSLFFLPFSLHAKTFGWNAGQKRIPLHWLGGFSQIILKIANILLVSRLV